MPSSRLMVICVLGLWLKGCSTLKADSQISKEFLDFKMAECTATSGVSTFDGGCLSDDLALILSACEDIAPMAQYNEFCQIALVYQQGGFVLPDLVGDTLPEAERAGVLGELESLGQY